MFNLKDLHSFYQSILNLRQNDAFEPIKNIVSNEQTKLSNYTDDVTGYCKYIASQIETSLNKVNIYTYWIDLNDLASIDHVILIAEYMTNNKVKRILIDPTYKQFTKSANTKLIKLKEWPSERLDKDILNDLLTDGITKIDDNNFKNYLNSFGTTNFDVSLDDYLLEQKLNRRLKR